MTRLYCNAMLSANTTLELPAPAARHIMVLRMRTGDNITLFNGQGGEYNAKIIDIHKHSTTVQVLSYSPAETELPYRITLAQAMPETSKMDTIIEKAVELGVARISPLKTLRSVVRLTEERAEKRIIRWKSIIIAASEQSGRNRLVEINEILPFPDWLKKTGNEPVLLLSPHAGKPFVDWISQAPPQNITLLIGPEGGFSQEEESLAIQHGAITLSLGSRILRTETAGMATVAAMTAMWSKTKK